MTDAIYALGHSDPELARLDIQARLIEPFTRAYLLEAGLAPGMRVLDLGSGGGHTAFLAAALVGPEGAVVGTDRAARSVAMAMANAAARGIDNVTFHEGDPAAMTFDRPFDAVIGRYVLIFQPEPATWLAAVARHVRPGGIILFHEPDGSFGRSWPPAPLHDRCFRQVIEGFGATGCDTNIAARIRQIFEGAGLRPPTMRFQAIIGGATETDPWLDVLAGMAVSLRPAMERLGLPAAGKGDAATLAADLRRDVEAQDSTILGRVEIGAWTTA